MKSVLLSHTGLVIAVVDYSLANQIASFMSHTVLAMPWNLNFVLPKVGSIYRA